MKKINDLIRNKYFYYIICIFLFLLLSAYDLKLKLNSNLVSSNLHIILLIIIGIIISFIFAMISNLTKKKKLKIDVIFPILGILIGVMYLIGSPLFTGSDEHNHYYRIYEITEGNFLTPVQKDNIVGDKLPKSLYDTFTNEDKDNINRNVKIKYRDEISMIKYKLNENTKIQYGTEYATEYSNTALYCPIQYLPQIIGFMIGKLFNFGPFLLGILGRLFNLIFYVVICTYFLKKLPRLKTFAALILLSPTLISNATTLSADAFTNALIFGFLTLIICNCYNKNRINKNEKVLFLLLSILLASCKIVYLPFVFLLLLLPQEKYKNRKDQAVFIGACVVISVIVSVVWMQFTNPYFDAYYINTNLQKQHILSNIVRYFVVVMRTYLEQFTSLILNIFAGNNMYHAQLPVYNFLSISYLLLVIFSFFVKEEKKKYESSIFTWKQNAFIIFIMLAILALLTTAIYIQCTATFIAIDNPIVVGLQGRYYLALVLCTLLIADKKNIAFKINSNELLIDINLMMHIFILLQMFVCFVI